MATANREQVLVGENVTAAVALAAEQVAEALGGEAPRRTIALAGGKTPARLYTALAAPPYRDRVRWERVEWFWGDERAVPPNHPDSNYRMARETLLDPLHVAGERIHRMPADAADLRAAAAAFEQTIRTIVPGPRAAGNAASASIPPFDLILLGVGADGHTASLFPGTDAVAETQRLVVANHVPAVGGWRMTMTLPLLQAARHILFLVTGAAKADIIGRLLAEPPPEELPAAKLRTSPGQVTWVLDTDAARLVRGRTPAL